MLTGAAILTPSASKHPKRALATVKLMTLIFEKLDFSNPLDTAVASCFSTIVYLEVTVIHIPGTKCSSEGEDIFWSHQEGITDPKAALDNHL